MSAPEDDLEKLRQAFRAAAPRPDATARAETLRRAMAAYDAASPQASENSAKISQASDARSRPSKDPRQSRGIFAGVWAVIDRLTPKVALGAGASLATLAIAMVLVTGSQPPRPDGPPEISMPEISPVSRRAATEAPTQDFDAAIPPMSKQAVTAESAPATSAAEGAGAVADVAPMARMQVAPANGLVQSPRAPAPMPQAEHFAQPESRDRFAEAPRQGLQITAEAPVSTFSIDVDTASWAWLRGALRHGQRPDPAAIRLEEMVNYFPYDYAAPATDLPFATTIDTFETPWNAGTQLVRIGLQGRLPELAARPALSLVFLIDTSGSMQGEDRIGLLKASFAMLLGSLRPEDRVAIVAYAGSAGEVLAPTAASERATILNALERLEAGGSTAGGEGLELAYATAAKMGGADRVSRVVLATDGDFNLGPASPEALTKLVAEKRKSGTYLSVLGFGRGNLDDAVMQALAQNGNGQAAYIDSAEEARKVLVDQAAGALFPIADDVKIQVEWNPAVVAEYRLLGYETRALAREDFANDKVDAGEIGAGHQVTALYEITPVASAARLTEPLRYGSPQASELPSGEAGWLRLRYKTPGTSESQLIEAPIPAGAGQADADARFAAAIAGFGQLLAGSTYLGNWGFDAAIALAEGSKGEDRFGYRSEAIGLMRTAAALHP